MSAVSKVVLRALTLYTPKIKSNLAFDNSSFTVEKAEADNFPIASYSHFPVIITESGIPWPPANLYLLSKLEHINTPSPKTLESIANDLVTFKRFLDTEEISHDFFPKRRINRPTYRFRAYLVEEIRNKNIATSTAKRKMSSIIGFYRWLLKQPTFQPEYPPWKESERFITFHDNFGFTQSKSVKKTDLSLRVQEQYATDGINDGGKLKPLTKPEQRSLAIALNACGNIEMTLIFLIALTSGARVQSVCTIRRGDLSLSSIYMGLCIVHAGNSTLVETKFNKRMTIFIPLWVMEKLITYAQSPRAINRKANSPHYKDDEQSQYLFLTKSGKPYYISEKDPQIASYRSPPRGDAIRQFIKTTLSTELQKIGHDFKFRFHDLRATFGLNLIEQFTDNLEQGDISRFDLLMLVRERMGHQKLETTEGYLNYRVKNKNLTQAQNNYENFLRELADNA